MTRFGNDKPEKSPPRGKSNAAIKAGMVRSGNS